MVRMRDGKPVRMHPYGRRPDSHPLIGEPGWEERGAEWVPFVLRRSVPMPQGRGFRWLASCPRCERWVIKLYRPSGAEVWWCRHCWGLRYPSQYTGRRPESNYGPLDTSRLEALLDSAWRARKNPQVCGRRLARLAVTKGIRDERELEFVRALIGSWAREDATLI